MDDGSDHGISLAADIDGEAAGDQSGRSVSLSADGRTVAIGADLGMTVMAVTLVMFVFIQWSGSVAGSNLGADIDGEAAGDNSGMAGVRSLVCRWANRSDWSSTHNDGNGEQFGPCPHLFTGQVLHGSQLGVPTLMVRPGTDWLGSFRRLLCRWQDQLRLVRFHNDSGQYGPVTQAMSAFSNVFHLSQQQRTRLASR